MFNCKGVFKEVLSEYLYSTTIFDIVSISTILDMLIINWCNIVSLCYLSLRLQLKDIEPKIWERAYYQQNIKRSQVLITL
jgi:hypothetical protein